MTCNDGITAVVLASLMHRCETGGSVNILLVDDHTIVRSGLRRLLAALPDVHISEAATGQEALTLGAGRAADVDRA